MASGRLEFGDESDPCFQVLSLKTKNNELIRALEKEAREHALMKEEALLHKTLAIQSKEEMIELKGKHKMELEEEVQLVEKAIAGSTHDGLGPVWESCDVAVLYTVSAVGKLFCPSESYFGVWMMCCAVAFSAKYAVKMLCKKLRAEVAQWDKEESYAKAIELFHKSRALQQEKSQYLLELDDLKTQVLSLKTKNNELIRTLEKEAREHALTKEETLLHKALVIQSKEEMIMLKGNHKMELEEEVQLVEKALAGSTHDVLVEEFANLRIVCNKLYAEVAQQDKKVELRTTLTDMKEIYREHINALGGKIEA